MRLVVAIFSILLFSVSLVPAKAEVGAKTTNYQVHQLPGIGEAIPLEETDFYPTHGHLVFYRPAVLDFSFSTFGLFQSADTDASVHSLSPRLHLRFRVLRN